MANFSRRRFAWLGVAFILAAVFEVAITAGSGLRFEPSLIISTAAVALAGAILAIRGFRSTWSRHRTGARCTCLEVAPADKFTG